MWWVDRVREPPRQPNFPLTSLPSTFLFPQLPHLPTKLLSLALKGERKWSLLHPSFVSSPSLLLLLGEQLGQQQVVAAKEERRGEKVERGHETMFSPLFRANVN